METAFRKPLKQSLRNSFLFLTVPRVHFRLLLYSVQAGANPFVTLPFHLAFHFPPQTFLLSSFPWYARPSSGPCVRPNSKQSAPVQPSPGCAVQIPEVTFTAFLCGFLSSTSCTFILLLLTSLQFPEALEQQQQLRMQLCRKPRAFTTQEVRSHFILYRYFNIFKKSSMLVCSHLFSSL